MERLLGRLSNKMNCEICEEKLNPVRIKSLVMVGVKAKCKKCGARYSGNRWVKISLQLFESIGVIMLLFLSLYYSSFIPIVVGALTLLVVLSALPVSLDKSDGINKRIRNTYENTLKSTEKR